MKITSFNANRVSLKIQPPRLIPYYLGHFLIYLGCLLILLVSVWLFFKVQRLYTHYQLAVGYLAYFEDLGATGPADPPELAQLHENVQGMAQSLEALYQEAQPFLPLARNLGWVPVYGDELQATPILLAAGRDLGRTGETLSEALAPLLEAEAKAEKAEGLPLLVTCLAGIEADLVQAETQFQYHQQMINKLDTSHFSPRLAGRVNQLQVYLPQLISAVQLLRAVPTLLGATSPQTYLILTQNSDELRPSGGYITAAGHVVLDRGRIIEFVIQDSYAVDKLSLEYPYPPAPLYQYMKADYWVLRDASWSPDFPATAEVAGELYKLGQGVSADGVIALDQQALPYLLRAFEPVQVENEQVTSSNVIQLMRQHWAPKQGQALDSEWWLQRKSFLVLLAEALRSEFEQELDLGHWPLLLQNLAQILQEKHLLVSLKDPDLAKSFYTYNWNGTLRAEPGDYLMTVDANVGFNKANLQVEQYLNYQVILSPEGSVEAHAHLVYQHLAPRQPQEPCLQEPRYDPIYEQNMIRCYWNYFRLVVPAEAQLISGPQIVVPGQHLLRGQATTGAIDVAFLDSDKISWGQLFLLPPGEAVSLDYHYTLPAGTAQFVEDQWEYKLYLQKQAGTLEPEVEVVVILPEGAQVRDRFPLPASQAENKFSYQLKLKTDQTLYISYSLP